jgi:hypothetical protein
MNQGDPCPNCDVPVYASARVGGPGGILKIIFAAFKSIFTVARGGVGSIQIGETPKGPVEAACINCGTISTIHDTSWSQPAA